VSNTKLVSLCKQIATDSLDVWLLLWLCYYC